MGTAGRSPNALLKKENLMNALMTRGGLFDDFFRDVAPGFYIKPLHGDALPTPAQIKVDVKESGDAYTVQAEIPGVPKEDIQVAVDGNVVSLRAEIKQQDSTSQDEKTLRSERYYGAVSRSFQLASDIDQTQAKAKYDNGVLTLTLPKKQAMSGAQRLTIE
jgi:HSP20 family protein